MLRLDPVRTVAFFVQPRFVSSFFFFFYYWLISDRHLLLLIRSIIRGEERHSGPLLRLTDARVLLAFRVFPRQRATARPTERMEIIITTFIDNKDAGTRAHFKINKIR
jgi:hypothetical protein